MSAGLALGCGSFISIRTKADVMKFALEMTAERQDNGKVKFDKKKAKEMFDFFCENVDLVDSDVVPVAGILDPFFNKIKEVMNAERECKCRCKNGD